MVCTGGGIESTENSARRQIIMKINWAKKLSSRKFWALVAGQATSAIGPGRLAISTLPQSASFAHAPFGLSPFLTSGLGVICGLAPF